jgi:hypothetical protein
MDGDVDVDTLWQQLVLRPEGPGRVWRPHARPECSGKTARGRVGEKEGYLPCPPANRDRIDGTDSNMRRRNRDVQEEHNMPCRAANRVRWDQRNKDQQEKTRTERSGGTEHGSGSSVTVIPSSSKASVEVRVRSVSGRYGV